MLADESVKHQEDREEVYNPKNNFGLAEIIFPKKKSRDEGQRSPQMTLGERAKLNRK